MSGPGPAAWIGFVVFVVAMLAVDLGFFQRRRHVMATKEALGWFGVWVGLAMAFNLGVLFFHSRGTEAGLEFFSGYLVEESLSVDNIFVFLIIFGYFKVPAAYQHRILIWGILGALVLRAIFILGGLALLTRFQLMSYLFGTFLVATGVSMLVKQDKPPDPQQNWAVRFVRRFFRVSDHLDRDRFVTRIDGRLWATPLLVALLVIESSDIVFAADSIPAVFAITPDPFIVFTSNIFAMLGIRSLYFAVAGFLRSFHFLRYGFAAIIVILGLKMLLSRFIEVPIAVSLILIVFILLLCVIVSLLRPRPADLKRIFGRTARLGLIPFRSLLYIENLLNARDLLVRDVMRRREDVQVIRPETPWTETMAMMRKTRFSRYPVIAPDSAKPLGVLHVKDVALWEKPADMDAASLRPLVRRGLEIRENLPVSAALAQFRRHSHEMGFVLDQNGAWLGIITVEDVLEQLVGELDDVAELGHPDTQFSLADALGSRRIVLGLQTASLDAAVATLVAALPPDAWPAAAVNVLHAFEQRADKGAVFSDAAVRFARLPGIQQAVLALGHFPEGIEVGSAGQRVAFVFLVVTPDQLPALPARVAASIARVFESDYVKHRLLAAQRAEEVIEVIRAAEQLVPA